ncbi:MAG TPA: DUF924 family protein [Burkholderiales bacterium]|nr:DUF924 family protein [Burkholderiales bacterium]
MHYETIIDFWFKEIEPKLWWKKDSDFDRLIADRFLEVHKAAARCELHVWRNNPLGRLAEIIVLDQFSRNIYRGSPLSFNYDPIALALAQEAITAKANQSLNQSQKAFLYMPFMHSESRVIHELAMKLFKEPGLESNLDFEIRHKAIIDRFGRFPHRNEILGRQSTAEEISFLKEAGSSF